MRTRNTVDDIAHLVKYTVGGIATAWVVVLAIALTIAVLAPVVMSFDRLPNGALNAGGIGWLQELIYSDEVVNFEPCVRDWDGRWSRYDPERDMYVSCSPSS